MGWNFKSCFNLELIIFVAGAIFYMIRKVVIVLQKHWA